MLPPQALEALKLSQTQPNDVLTVALSVDAETGEIQCFRFFAYSEFTGLSKNLRLFMLIDHVVQLVEADTRGRQRGVKLRGNDRVH
jgi:hypothetical protein